MAPQHIKRIVFFSSLAILVFEMVLIRAFSIRFSYHYASLIISIAMTGLVFGGIAAFLKRDMFLRAGIDKCAALLCLSFPLIFIFAYFIPMDYYRMLWENIQVLYLFIFMLICALPFFLYAIVLSLALAFDPSTSNRVYAADLIGASAGVTLAVILMEYISPDHIIAVPSMLLTFVLYFEFKNRFLLKTVFLFFVLFLSSMIVSGQFTAELSPYKGLMQALKEEGSKHLRTIYSSDSRLDIFKSTGMKSAPGLSLSYTRPVPQGLGLALDGEITGVMLDDKQIFEDDFLFHIPSALPYLLRKPEKVLVLGFKNSIDAFMPFYFGVKTVYITEKDHSISKFLSSQYAADSIYNKSLHDSSGRLFLQKRKEYFDIISISKTGFFPSGTFGLQEDYELTTEALRAYLDHLTNDGMLSIQMFLLHPARYELRLMNNIIHALKKENKNISEKHLLIYRSWDTINFLMKKNYFSAGEQETINTFLTSRHFDIIYGNNFPETRFITGVDYNRIFGQLIDNRQKDVFINNYAFDISTTSDNRPFFHYFFKADKLREIYDLSGKKWSYFIHEGMTLPFIILFQFLFLILLLAFFFVASKCYKKEKGCYLSGIFTTVYSPLYFIFIGFAFMFAEMFFIHRLILVYGSPVRAFSITLVAFLLSSGAGSLVCGYLSDKSALKIMHGAPLIALSYFVVAIIIPKAINNFYYIIPFGFFLGFFFPMGIKIFCAGNTKTIPVSYALNGAASILAPLLASMIGVACGLRTLLVLTFLFYGFALFFLSFTGHRHKNHTA